MLQRLMFTMVLGVVLAACSALPQTYSSIINRFPSDVTPCSADVSITEQDNGLWLVQGRQISNFGNMTFKCPGAKVLLETEATVDGKSYEAGTMLVMNHNERWVRVTSFD